MLTFSGAGVGAGIAIGRAVVRRHTSVRIPAYKIPAHLIENEVRRFGDAVRHARTHLATLQAQAGTEGNGIVSIMEAHRLMLHDPLLTEQTEHLIRSRAINAEQALRLHAEHLIAAFDAIEDDYLRGKKNDIRQVVHRILAVLINDAGAGDSMKGGLESDSDVAHADAPADIMSDDRQPPTARAARDNDNNDSDARIVAADDLSPADTVLLRRHNIQGFVTNYGGPISHTAILARGLGIPAVVGLHGAVRHIHDGVLLIIDGKRGLVLVDPDQRTLEEYRTRRTRIRQRHRQLARLSTERAETRDGQRITLLANLELPEEIEAVRRTGADGVGLYRTEYLFVNRASPPPEEEQYLAYSSVARAMQPCTVTVRTLDLGAEQQRGDDYIENRDVADYGENGERTTPRVATNPALGQRAVRFCLNYPALFRPQLRAILRASAHGNVQLMIPMLSSLDELEQTLALICDTRRQLTREGLDYDQHMAVGGMIEVPAAAIVADLFAKRLDFLSIGTNDLIQYTLAIDRVDDEVNYLYDPLHPAVLRLIARIIRAGQESGTPVSMCGEMAGDVQYTRLLLGLGLSAFSMEPSAILEVKQIVRATQLATLSSAVHDIMQSDTPQAIRAQLKSLNAGVRVD